MPESPKSQPTVPPKTSSSEPTPTTQSQTSTDTVSFQNALRSALRGNPDTIPVGEVRDLETFRLAMAAAETGHLNLAKEKMPVDLGERPDRAPRQRSDHPIPGTGKGPSQPQQRPGRQPSVSRETGTSRSTSPGRKR